MRISRFGIKTDQSISILRRGSIANSPRMTKTGPNWTLFWVSSSASLNTQTNSARSTQTGDELKSVSSSAPLHICTVTQGLHMTIASLALTHRSGIKSILRAAALAPHDLHVHNPICGTSDQFHLFYLIPALVNVIQRSFEAFTGMGMR